MLDCQKRPHRTLAKLTLLAIICQTMVLQPGQCVETYASIARTAGIHTFKANVLTIEMYMNFLQHQPLDMSLRQRMGHETAIHRASADYCMTSLSIVSRGSRCMPSTALLAQCGSQKQSVSSIVALHVAHSCLVMSIFMEDETLRWSCWCARLGKQTG